MDFRESNLGFATADAEPIEFVYRQNELRLTFLDLDGNRRAVVFEGVYGQSWCVESEFYSGLRDDMTYVAQQSELVQRLVDCGQITSADDVEHHVLCFNAAGMLEVVCRAVRVIQ